jgi:hypothetical protein
VRHPDNDYSRADNIDHDGSANDHHDDARADYDDYHGTATAAVSWGFRTVQLQWRML